MTIADAKAQIEQLQVDAEALDQNYLAVQQQVTASKADLAQKQQDAQAQAQKVDALRKQVGQAALAQFQDRNVDTAAQLLLNSDTEGFLSQVSTIEKVGANQNTVLQAFQQQRASLADLQKTRQTELAALEKKESDLATLKAGSAQKLTDAQAVLAKLTTEQQQTLADPGPAAVPGRADARRERSGYHAGPDDHRPRADASGKGHGRPGLGHEAARQAVPVRGHGAERVRLLRPHARSLEGRGRQPEPHLCSSSSATARPSPGPSCSRATSSSSTAASATSRCTRATAWSCTRPTPAPASGYAKLDVDAVRRRAPPRLIPSQIPVMTRFPALPPPSVPCRHPGPGVVAAPARLPDPGPTAGQPVRASGTAGHHHPRQ